MSRGAGTVRLTGLLVDHRANLEPGECVLTVEPWAVLAQPLNPEAVLLAGAWQAQTGRGNGYRGITLAVVEGDLAVPAAATQLRIAPTLVRRETDDASERIVVEANVAVTALADAPA